MADNRCVICGEIIPEGRQVCPSCENNVDHPRHYNQGGIECIDAIKAAVTGKPPYEAWLAGQVIKYVWRYDVKNGLEDLQKARFYLERLIGEVDDF
jgi:hypothetical protein